MILGCVGMQEENSAGTTATGNNGVVVGDVNQNKYVKRLIADGDISNTDVVVYLYRKDNPYVAQNSTQLNENNQFKFEDLEYTTYTVRVEVGEDKGGIKENIVVDNSDIVYITIEINIYITNIINNFFLGGEVADVKNLLSYYGGTQMDLNPDGSFTIKTLPGTSETSLLVTQNNDSLELKVRGEAETLVITSNSEELEIIQSSQTHSSSSIDLISSNLAISSSVLEVSSVIISSSSLESENNMIDIDGNIYASVRIGEQVWMAENLRATKYSDGTAIPNITNDSAWFSLNTGGWCHYNNEHNYDSPYGKIYNWYAVETELLCPIGWHVPTNVEWTVLTDYLGANGHSGTALKATSYWNSNGNGTDDYGWNGLPGGNRFAIGDFLGLGSSGYWWSSSQYSANEGWYRHLNYFDGLVYLSHHNKRDGFYVRCLKD
jgi:uncharacterized protein (TIGR02145 family)